jgi:outer membrane protein assembly factor BamE
MLFRSIFFAACISLISGCVYRLDVQQGNEITEQMVSQVKPGMTKREVVKVLGYPLINDPFNSDRWDYYYSLKQGRSKSVIRQSASLIFNGDSLESIDTRLPGDENPS